MENQRGFTLVEMVVAVAITLLISSLAFYSLTGFLTSARISRVANQIADQVSLSRERAIARYEQWRIRFEPSGGSSVVRTYVVESCVLSVATPGVPCSGAWTEQTRIVIEQGTGLIVQDDAGNPVTELVFDRTGRFLTTTTEISICGTVTSGGNDSCRTGALGRLVRIRAFSGIIET